MRAALALTLALMPVEALARGGSGGQHAGSSYMIALTVLVVVMGTLGRSWQTVVFGGGLFALVSILLKSIGA